MNNKQEHPKKRRVFLLAIACLSMCIGILLGIAAYSIIEKRSIDKINSKRERINETVSEIQQSFELSTWRGTPQGVPGDTIEDIEEFIGLSRIVRRDYISDFKFHVKEAIEIWNNINDDSRNIKRYDSSDSEFLIGLERYMTNRLHLNNLFVETYHIALVIDSLIYNNCNNVYPNPEVMAHGRLLLQFNSHSKALSDSVISEIQSRMIKYEGRKEKTDYITEPIERLRNDPLFYSYVLDFFGFCYKYHLYLIELSKKLE